MTAVGVAASSEFAAEGGARVARQGGNAVDAAIAAALVSMVTEPGVVSLGGGGFVTLWPAGGKALVIDGNSEMPGRGLPADRLGGGAWEITLQYGGGVSTLIGHGSATAPGGLAALEKSWRQFGKLPWRALVEPAWEHARDGFPLGRASYNYLVHSGELVFGWHADSRRALFDDEGRLAQPGDTIHVPHLADSLELIAEQGAAALYTGVLAQLIIDDMEANGGVVTARDLAEYQPVVREPLTMKMAGWSFATNPPPAIGGVALAAMLTLMGDRPRGAWTASEIAYAAHVQQAVLGYRRDRLDLSDDFANDAQRLLDLCAAGDPNALLSPSTAHVSAVDKDGLACSVTMSAGYSSGVMPPGTGIWLNNSLGEMELNRRGLVAGEPGERLVSNMAPTVARNEKGTVLAIGSPGADRITTALMMTLLGMVRLDMTLHDAIAHPRLHVEFAGGQPRIAVEPGLDVSECQLPVRVFDEISMFFGGVGAALCYPDGRIKAASDSRRTGGARVSA